jgi:tetratricopeptide (TPR) repeat protein
MKYIVVLFAFSILSLMNAQGQDVEFKKKNFSDASGFDQAINNIKKGDDYFAKHVKWYYQKALECYLKANEFNPSNSLLNFKIGVCFLNSSDKAASLNYFLKAQSLKVDVDPKIEYAIAQGCQYNLQFDEAIIHYNNAMKALNIKSSDAKMEKVTSFVMVIEKKIAECESGKLLVANPIKVKIENLGTGINSVYTDYVPLVTTDEKQMFFTSRREGSTGSEIDPNESEYFEDVYQSLKDQDKWGAPKQIEGAVNTNSHDACVGLSLDGKTLFIYRGLVNGGDLYECKNEVGMWVVPKPMIKVNTSFHETSACLSQDGKTLYLTSDRKDKTIGMRDIFVSHLDSNGEWSEPENLGATVNTPNDEEGVSISPDGNTLYFSSTGHNTIGGFDMFKSVFQNGKWSKPENLGYPLNTPDDEMYIQVFGSQNSEHGYFSATRKEGLGLSDIYSFEIMNEQIVSKNVSDTTENPENYRVPIEGGDPASLFVNVNSDSISTQKVTKEVPVTENKEVKEVVNDVKKEETNIINKNDSIVEQNNQKIIQEINSNNTVNNFVQKDKSEPILTTENVIFKVQVGACHRQIPQTELHQRYTGKKNITMEMHEGWYKYVIGSFNKYSEAKSEKVTCGTNDAWVVVYKEGKRVPISDVLSVLSYYPLSKLTILMLS